MIGDRSKVVKPDSRTSGAEVVYQGLGVSRGVAIGVVYRHDANAVYVPEKTIPESEIKAECERFQRAIEGSARQIAKLQTQARAIEGAAGEELGYLLYAYRQMLSGSRLVRGVETMIIQEAVNAETAVRRTIADIEASFSGMEDAYLAARVDDIREVGRRLLRQLLDSPDNPFVHLPKNAILLSDELSPADTVLLDPSMVAGLGTMLGGVASHTAIVAQSLGLPAVVGINGVLAGIKNGQIAVIDGVEGQVVVNPDPETLMRYRNKRARFLRIRRTLRSEAHEASQTQDGVEIALHGNVELPGEIDDLFKVGGMGVGLMRSEFLYMNRADLPGEDEQYEIYKSMVQKLDGLPLTVRTLDVGGDKVAPSLGAWEGINPALGLRAIRLSLRFPELLETQLAAILRAGAHGPVRILIPMISQAREMIEVRSIMEKVARNLRAKAILIASPLPPVGAMIEIPGAAVTADILARHCDFFALGTNDLVQYTLAVDRAEETVSHLFEPLHLAILRLIKLTVEAGGKARIPVSICGEIGGDPSYTALLLGLGIRNLSMAVNDLAGVRKRVRSLKLSDAEALADTILSQSETHEIVRLLDEFNHRLFGPSESLP